LASLAAVLRSEGHEAIILDYNTVETMRSLVDDEIRHDLESIWIDLQGSAREMAIEKLMRIGKQVEKRGDQKADEIAADVIGKCIINDVDFVGFKLWNGDGYERASELPSE